MAFIDLFSRPPPTRGLLLAALIPFLAAAVQWALWPYLPPLTWLFFYPAAFFGAWAGGLYGGLLATALSLALAWYLFIPHAWSWVIADDRHLYSIGIFFTMSVLSSLLHQRLLDTTDELRRIALRQKDHVVKESAREFRLLSDSQAAAHIGSWMMVPATGRITWSAESFRLYGLSPTADAAPAFDQFLDLLHPQDRAAVIDWFDACLAGRRPAPVEYRPLLPSGEERWLLRSGILETDAHGRPLRMLGTLQDITERKRAETQMRTSQAQLAAALASMTDAVCITDADGRFIHFNEAFAAFHKFQRKAQCPATVDDYPAILEVFMADATATPVAQWPVSRALRGERATNADLIRRV